MAEFVESSELSGSYMLKHQTNHPRDCSRLLLSCDDHHISAGHSINRTGLPLSAGAVVAVGAHGSAGGRRGTGRDGGGTRPMSGSGDRCSAVVTEGPTAPVTVTSSDSPTERRPIDRPVHLSARAADRGEISRLLMARTSREHPCRHSELADLCRAIIGGFL